MDECDRKPDQNLGPGHDASERSMPFAFGAAVRALRKRIDPSQKSTAFIFLAAVLLGAVATWLVTEHRFSRERTLLQARIQALEGALAEAKKDADQLAWAKEKWREEMNLRLQVRERQVQGQALRLFHKRKEEMLSKTNLYSISAFDPPPALQVQADEAMMRAACLEAEADFPFPESRGDAAAP